MELDVDMFYIERDNILNQPDEDFDIYRRRILSGNTESYLVQLDFGFPPFLEEEDIVSLYSNEIGSYDAPTIPSEESAAYTTAQSSMDKRSRLSDPVTNVEEMHGSDARIDKIGIKREPSLIQSTYPAKRSRTDESKSETSQLSTLQTSVLSSACHNMPPLPGRGEDVQVIGDGDQPSEILSFTPSPRHSRQESPSPAQSSPIDSFSRIMTHSSNSGLWDNQKVQKPGLIPKFSYGPILYGAASKGKQVDTAINSKRQDKEGPPTSLIKNPSIHQSLTPAANENQGKSVIASGSSSLCLEVKKRVAKHLAMKQQNRVIPPISKITDSCNPGGPAMEKKLAFNGATDISNVSVGSVPRAVTSSRDPKANDSAGTNMMQRSRTQPKAQKSKSNKKEKQALISPVEYAQRSIAANKPGNSIVQFLEGKDIFYIGGDMQYAGERTRKRMDIIVRYGGNLIPVYDPSRVTHIVTDTSKQHTLRALGHKRLSDIPSHIPVVNWNWISSGINRLSRLDKEDIKIKLDDVWMYAAFSERMDITARNKLIIPPAAPTPGLLIQGEISSEQPRNNSTPDQLRSMPLPVQTTDLEHDDQASGFETSSAISINTGSGAKQIPFDPLQEFYAEAREASENKLFYGDDDESDEEIYEFLRKTPHQDTMQQPKRGWTCDSKELQKAPCVNQDIIEKLQELQELHRAKLSGEDRWRAYSYIKSIRAIRGYPKRIQSYHEARSIRGVGNRTALKIMEILQTGDLQRINYERTDDVQVTQLFQGIYGVGISTAFKWYSAGCRTLDDLRNQKAGVRLNSAQLIGLQYYDDINSRMPRSEAKAIFELIKPLALSIDQKLFVEIMGSYRRGKSDCGDIDILITRPVDDNKTHSGILTRLLPILRKKEIITEDLAIPEDMNSLECVYRGLCRLPQRSSCRRRIDFLTVPWESRGAALLYYTGDGIFNRAMRLKANKMGYSLNQRGLFSGVVRDPKDSRIKSNEGTLIASETEEEIFRILNVPWQEPHERIRG